MKAYAQFIEKDGITYRINTLLQFGNSWNHIGNIVLANPGSSNIIDKIEDNIHKEIFDLYETFHNREYNRDKWFQCNIDPTMERIEKIFNGWYIDNDDVLELNGVVQLFNSFNIKNQNLDEAINSLPIDNKLLYPIGIEKYFNHKPTYFGFSKAVIYNDRLNPIVKNIFNNSTKDIKNIYHSQFEKNSFYHPTYINRSYKRDLFIKYKEEVLIPFKRLIEE